MSFLLPTPMGPQIRTGAMDAAGDIVDLVFLGRGDVVELEVERLGTLRNRVV